MSTSVTQTSIVGSDRRGLSTRTSQVRLTALIALSLVIIVFALVNFFIGFSSTQAKLLFISLGHLLLAPVAFIGAMRLGPLLAIAYYIAILVTLADGIELIIRSIDGELTFEFIALFAVNIVFLVLDVIYLIGLSSLRKLDDELNNESTADIDVRAKKAALISQESNALRSIAVVDIIALVLVFLTVLIFVGFSLSTEVQWTFFYLAHVVVVILALTVAPLPSDAGIIAFTAVVVIATVLDFVQLILRLLNTPSMTLMTVSVANIASTVLLFINIVYILLDVAYLVSAFSLIDAKSIVVDKQVEEAIDTSPFAKAPETTTKTASSVLLAMAELNRGVRQRGKK